MGIYLNPGNKGFWESTRSKIYVDKTGPIACINERINTGGEICLCQQAKAFWKIHGAENAGRLLQSWLRLVRFI